MSNALSPIDDVIDQTYTNDIPITCNICLCQTKQLTRMSCTHYICTDCGINQAANPIIQCSICKTDINVDRFKGCLLNSPMKRLYFYFRIEVGDIIWTYGNKFRKWIFPKDNMKLINIFYAKFKAGINRNIFPIETNIGTGIKTHFVDFINNSIYPKNSPNDKTDILSLVLRSGFDLKKHKIIGVDGKLL